MFFCSFFFFSFLDIVKFLALQLGTMSRILEDKDHYVINGKHSQEDLMKLLDTFISKYVLCRKCENPETIIKATSSKISLTCKACGAITDFPPLDKFETFISKTAAGKSPKVVKKKSADAGEAAAGEGEEGEKKKVIKKVVRKKVVVKKSPGEQTFRANLPVYAIESRINSALALMGNGAELEKIESELRNIYDSLGEYRNCEHMVKAIYSTIFNEDVAGKIMTRGQILAVYTAGRRNVQFAVMELMNESVVEGDIDKKKVPALFKKLFDADVLAEEDILAWAEENAEAPLTKAAESFTNWLKTAEIED